MKPIADKICEYVEIDVWLGLRNQVYEVVLIKAQLKLVKSIRNQIRINIMDKILPGEIKSRTIDI